VASKSLLVSLHAGTCPAGYVRHASSCYQFVNASKTWVEAEKHCQMTHQDSHLVSIETRAEMQAIIDYRSHNAGINRAVTHCVYSCSMPGFYACIQLISVPVMGLPRLFPTLKLKALWTIAYGGTVAALSFLKALFMARGLGNVLAILCRVSWSS